MSAKMPAWAGLITVVAVAWMSFTGGVRWAASRRQIRRHQGVFVLALSLSFKSVQDRDRWIALWRPLADYVLAEEPNTLSYEIALSDADERNIFLVERYLSKQDLTVKHQQSLPYKVFKASVKQLNIEYETKGQSYYETNFGFM